MTPPVERGVTGIRVEKVYPSDRVRIVNVLDAVLPAAKVGVPPAAYPGVLGPTDHTGVGRTDVIDDLLVLSVCDYSATHDLDSLPNRPDGPSIVDIAGPGSRYHPWEPSACVIVSFDADPAVPLEEVDLSIRRATFQAACDLAVAGSEDPVRAVERFDATPVEGSPTVVVISHVGSEGPLLDTFLYGKPLRDTDPTLLSAAEVRDGAVTSGAYDWAALRNPTCLYQGSRLLKRLQTDHGSLLRFGGVIVGRTYLPTLEEKRRNARLCAETARSAGADGVIITTFQSGNSQTDTMLTIEACEELGIRTVGIISETDDGLTDFSPTADCLVSSGNENDLVAQWQPERVLGGSDIEPGPVSVLTYLGAMSQLGDGRRGTVPA